jgi:glycosyltransferase involved in cell wall biosynthesis
LLLGEQVAARKDHPAVENLRVVYFVRTQDEGGVVSGAARQLRQYAEFAGRAGCTAVVHPSLQPLDERFDVAHLSNLDWSVETAHQLRLAKRCARRVVISPIHHRRRWVGGVPASDRGGFGRIAAEVTNQDGFERLRNFYLAGKNPRLIPEATRQLVTGVARRQRDILNACDAWFLLAKGERDSLDEDLDPTARETFVVPNGAEWSDEEPSLKDLPADFVLSVGRVEARKGQLTVARVLESLGVPGVFVGAPNSRHQAYVSEFRRFVEGSRHLRWHTELTHEEILPLYGAARLHVLASWFEVAPLVDLEAAAAGCRVVTTTHGHTSEYLGDWGVYWSPETGERGLRTAIERGLELGPDREQAERFRATLSWDLMAGAVLDGYASVLA